jgi:hypothetical protein
MASSERDPVTTGPVEVLPGVAPRCRCPQLQALATRLANEERCERFRQDAAGQASTPLHDHSRDVMRRSDGRLSRRRARRARAWRTPGGGWRARAAPASWTGTSPSWSVPPRPHAAGLPASGWSQPSTQRWWFQDVSGSAVTAGAVTAGATGLARRVLTARTLPPPAGAGGGLRQPGRAGPSVADGLDVRARGGEVRRGLARILALRARPSTP